MNAVNETRGAEFLPRTPTSPVVRMGSTQVSSTKAMSC